MQQEVQKHTEIANQGSLVKQFLDTTSHQLTYVGLTELHSHVKEGSLCVFFRNNHFATLTKQMLLQLAWHAIFTWWNSHF